MNDRLRFQKRIKRSNVYDNGTATSVSLIDLRSRVKARAESFLKKLLLPLSLDSTTVRGHHKKRGNNEWRRPFSVIAPTFCNMMAHFKSPVTSVEELRSMASSSLIQSRQCTICHSRGKRSNYHQLRTDPQKDALYTNGWLD